MGVGFPLLVKHFSLSSECDNTHPLKHGIHDSVQQGVFFLQTSFQLECIPPQPLSHISYNFLSLEDEKESFVKILEHE